MTLTGRHFRSCLEAKRAREKFLEMWPETCDACNAFGFHHYPGTRTTPPDHVLCASCLEDDKCPRCGERELEFVESEERYVDHSRCRACGWNELVINGKLDEDPIEGESAEDMVMPIWECFCEMEIGMAEEEGMDPEDWGEIVEPVHYVVRNQYNQSETEKLHSADKAAARAKRMNEGIPEEWGEVWQVVAIFPER